MVLRIRHRTVVGGVAAGVGLVAALTLIGLTNKHAGTPESPPGSPAAIGEPRTGTQPEVEEVVVLARAPRPSARPSGRPVVPRRRESAEVCQVLLDGPAELATDLPAAQAFLRLRAVAHQCGAKEVRTERVGDESFAVTTHAGYLAVVRVGDAMSVLRLLGPAGTLGDSDLIQRLKHAGGRLEVCPACVLRSPR